MIDPFWTPVAMADRDAIFEFVAAENPIAAIELDELFELGAAYLGQHPNMGRPGRIAGTRELVAHPNYVIVYDQAGECVRILRILHAARQWPPWKAG